ncbi:ADD domain-containing protein 1 isoform X2 [Haematobia irritans]|uniref:ADD domain-containing protein 1 isoform X2 n=1 Tax=Haematobia irritans TaxID=7368 RepID=UPI003F4FCA9B
MNDSLLVATANVVDSSKAITYEFHPSISEEERRFYLKAYPTVDVVRDRKVHCTVCKTHIGTAPLTETGIKMHPILRVSHCLKCHDFYNSGEFSKGEDGSELYCRWCGQGGEVYCCSSCPYVFCKSCIVKNLSRGVVADIEQNENWNCFSCAPKILWPLRAQHWALMNYIEQQKKEVYAMNVSEAEMNQLLRRDRSKCCRLSKTKCGNMSDSMESLDSVLSKRSHGSSGSGKKKHATPSPQPPSAKRAKTNDEVVCTPDLLSMLEPDCQITVAQKNQQRPMPSPSTSISRMQSQSSYGGAGSGMNQTSTPKTSAPPPLIMRNTGIKVRPTTQPPIVRRTVIGPRAPAPGGNGTPVYHTINGFRIDLNSAAQQETFRLPNGKLIQVKRQGPPPGGPGPSPSPQVHLTQSPGNWPQISAQQPQRVVPQTIASRPVQITQHPYPGPNIPGQPQVVRYHNSSMIGNTTINAISHNGTPLQAINGQIPTPSPVTIQQAVPPLAPGAPIRPVMVRHVFPETPIGQARTQLQEQVFNAMEICTHLTNKVQTLTNSNAYKQAKNYLEVKELYIHLSYLLTYAIGRFKGLQDKCLADMRNLGFVNDADCLENGQLAADKQASDDEDNEIEIVEPKTDLITLDSDDDDPPPPPPPASKNQKSLPSTPTTIAQARVVISPPQPVNIEKATAAPMTSTNITTTAGTYVPPSPATATPTSSAIPALTATPEEDENMDLMSMAQSFLASMLEVDIHEGPNNSPSSSDSNQVKKQPRKKTTNKPNPTLLKQKALMERERLEEMKRNDLKLKMKCAVNLTKAEEEYPFAKQMLEAKIKEKQQKHDEQAKAGLDGKDTIASSATTMTVNTGQETIEVQLVIEDDNMNSSSEELKKETKNKTKEENIININLDDSDEQDKSQINNELDDGNKDETTDMKNDKDKLNGKDESKEMSIKEVSEDNDKDTSMEIIEILEDKNGKDNSIEILEISKDHHEENEKEKQKESEKDLRANDNEGNNDERENTTEKDEAMKENITPLSSPKNSITNQDENKDKEESPMDIDSKDEEIEKVDKMEIDTTNDKKEIKIIEDMEDIEVYKEIEKVLQVEIDKEVEEKEVTITKEKEETNDVTQEDNQEVKEPSKAEAGENKEKELLQEPKNSPEKLMETDTIADDEQESTTENNEKEKLDLPSTTSSSVEVEKQQGDSLDPSSTTSSSVEVEKQQEDSLDPSSTTSLDKVEKQEEPPLDPSSTTSLDKVEKQGESSLDSPSTNPSSSSSSLPTESNSSMLPTAEVDGSKVTETASKKDDDDDVTNDQNITSSTDKSVSPRVDDTTATSSNGNV